MTGYFLLVTCPPMLGMQDQFKPELENLGYEVHCPPVVQTLSEEELIALVPRFDAWIIGDDPATSRVFAAGAAGRLKVAVKWGVGVDNVDFDGASSVGIEVRHTPGMFGREVADIALGYIIGLAREAFLIDRAVREGGWPKPRGISLAGKTVGVVGFGDIGRNMVSRIRASEMQPVVFDPILSPGHSAEAGVSVGRWPEDLVKCDFLVFCCALSPSNHHMLNADTLGHCKSGIRIVNVARGPLIDEGALVDAIAAGVVHSAALDVFEDEPLPMSSPLRKFDRCIFGSHNASNTVEAVTATNDRAIALMLEMLEKARG